MEHEWSLDNVDKKIVKKQLSEYSLTNRAEFEAELNSAILSGKVFSEDILSLSHMKQTKTSIAKQLLDYGSGKNVCLPSEEVSKSFKDAMKVVFNQKGGSFSIDIMADSKVQNLIEAHTDVLNRNIQRLEMSDTMRKRLTRSNYIFSGMKTFHELNEAFPSLLDSNGNRKTFEAFLNDVRKIDNTYNSNYLRAEYNFVQSSAEMAAKWERFSEDGDRYNLQYRTANDDKVRPEHAALNGVTLPPSDPFWEEYYPPNGWNCRCTVVQVRKSKYPATPMRRRWHWARRLCSATQRAFSISIQESRIKPYPTTILIRFVVAVTATSLRVKSSWRDSFQKMSCALRANIYELVWNTNIAMVSATTRKRLRTLSQP